MLLRPHLNGCSRPLFTQSLLGLALLTLSLFLTGCGSSSSSSAFRVDAPQASEALDFKILRDYILLTDDLDPQPQWAPQDNSILVRSVNGLGIIDELARRRFFDTINGQRPGYARWIDQEHFIFGPPEPFSKSAGGRITPSPEGLTVVSLTQRQPRVILQEAAIGAFRPLVVDGDLFAQRGENIMSFDVSDGEEIEIIEPGFDFVPAHSGRGYAVQTTPIEYEDHWTTEKSPGSLLIRWDGRNGSESSFIPGLMKPVWLPNGNILAHKPHKVPSRNAFWMAGGCDLIEITKVSGTQKVLATNVHSPDPHPELPLLVMVNRIGELVVHHYQTGEQRIIEGQFMNPQWNFDGTRLMAEYQGPDGKVELKVWILGWQRHGNWL